MVSLSLSLSVSLCVFSVQSIRTCTRYLCEWVSRGFCWLVGCVRECCVRVRFSHFLFVCMCVHLKNPSIHARTHTHTRAHIIMRFGFRSWLFLLGARSFVCVCSCASMSTQRTDGRSASFNNVYTYEHTHTHIRIEMDINTHSHAHTHAHTRTAIYICIFYTLRLTHIPCLCECVSLFSYLRWTLLLFSLFSILFFRFLFLSFLVPFLASFLSTSYFVNTNKKKIFRFMRIYLCCFSGCDIILTEKNISIPILGACVCIFFVQIAANERKKNQIKNTHDALVPISQIFITKFAFLDGSSFLSANRKYKIKRNYSNPCGNNWNLQWISGFSLDLDVSAALLPACFLDIYILHVCICFFYCVSFFLLSTTLSLLLLLLLFFLRWMSIE